jgi:DNA polymerase-3 subunit beta
VKFQVDRDAFTEAVAWTARALPSRAAAPVLAGLLFDATDSAVTVSGFDYDVSSRAGFAAEVGEPGRVLIHGRLLADIAKSLPHRPVLLATEGSKAMLSCGSSQFALQTLPVDDYPALPAMPAATGTVAAADLAAAAAQVAIAASRDDTIPMLTGIRIELTSDTLTLVSTDRFRLAYRELPWHPADPARPVTTALVAAKTMAAATRSLAGRDRVTVAVPGEAGGDGLIGFASGGQDDDVSGEAQGSAPEAGGALEGSPGSRRLTSRLLAGEFVRYRSLFPAEYLITATVETAAFLAAAKRVALVAERISPITLAFTAGEVGLQAGAGDEAQASETLDAVLEGEDVTASFNPAFLLDGLQAIDTEYAQLGFTVPGKPTVLRARQSLDLPARDDFRYLMLPLKAPGYSPAPGAA